MQMRWLAAVLLAVLALAAAGCGGSDSSSDSATVAAETTATEETAATETTEETTATDTSEETGVSGVLSEDCQELIGLAATFAEAFSATTSGQSADLEQSQRFFQEFAERVPEEIRDDYRIVADNYAKIVKAIEDAGQLPSQPSQAELTQWLQKVQSALANVDQAEVTAATTRIGAWAETNCPTGG